MKSKKKKFSLQKHKIISFILVVILTIIVIRILVLISDPNIIITGYELHHFYYGIILLIITNLLMLFGKPNFKLYSILSGASIGLIIDEFIYVAGGFGNQEFYFSTLPSVIILAAFIIIIAILINYRK